MITITMPTYVDMRERWVVLFTRDLPMRNGVCEKRCLGGVHCRSSGIARARKFIQGSSRPSCPRPQYMLNRDRMLRRTTGV